MKKKLILFGATNYAYICAMQSINFDTAEIVAFSDNDEYKWNIEYEGIKIVSPDKIIKQQFDYILICAWYSYKKIKQQLMDIGIEGVRILPFLRLNNIKALQDYIFDIDSNIIKSIYREGDKLLNELSEVNKVIARYGKMNKLDNLDVTDFEDYSLIAHAGGGYIKGEKREYTNSLEAFKEAIENGFKMFECDVWGMQNGKIIIGSRLKMQYPVVIDYTIPTLDDLITLICDDWKKKIILDIKYNTLDDFYRLLNEIDRVVKRFEQNGYENIKKQILIETFDEESTKYATNMRWECLLTDYRNPEGGWFMKSAVICDTYKVHTCMLDAILVKREKKYIDFLLNKNIKILCYTVDEIRDYSELRKMGISSCLTNYLKPVI